MYTSNRFSIVLNYASYLGYPSRTPLNVSLASGDLASIPSKWTSDIRHSVHQMRHLIVYVNLDPGELVHNQSRVLLENKKLEVAAIVGAALQELCEILAFSGNLTSLRVDFLDRGRDQLTMSNEHEILGCLGQLRDLKHVDICGPSKRAKDYLEAVMKMTKQSEKKRTDFPLARVGRSWELPG